MNGERCFYCGHDLHARGVPCEATTYFTKKPCGCPGAFAHELDGLDQRRTAA